MIVNTKIEDYSPHLLILCHPNIQSPETCDLYLNRQRTLAVLLVKDTQRLKRLSFPFSQHLFYEKAMFL